MSSTLDPRMEGVGGPMDHLAPEIAAAYRDALARGLPHGWTCTIDKRNRRKWTAPNHGRSCDSIPKALAISVDMGLLPPDTVIESGAHKKRKRLTGGGPGRKKKRPYNNSAAAAAAAASRKAPPEAAKERQEIVEHVEEEEDDDEEDDYESETPPEPMDPETSLDGLRRSGAPTTVHWDPDSQNGRKIGWKVRIAVHKSGTSSNTTGSAPSNPWVTGRVVRYDPHTHKHKIQLYEHDDQSWSQADQDKENAVWIWLRNEQHNLHLAVRMVWAHVKGYAWWPALVMETPVLPPEGGGGATASTSNSTPTVRVEFFGSGEVATLRETPECIRPFDPHHLDPIVAKHKKKRNAKAFHAAVQEYQTIQAIRRTAARHYADRAVHMARLSHGLVGHRVQVFLPHVHYPYGDTVTAQVRKYSVCQKKWLAAFELSKTGQKYPAAWLNLQSKESSLKILDKKKTEWTDEDLLPYLVGYQQHADSANANEPDDDDLATMLRERCCGCVDYMRSDGPRIKCDTCQSFFHLGCMDPPMTLETYQRLVQQQQVPNGGTPTMTCSRCVPCRGCYQRDVCFGSHPHPPPNNLSWDQDKSENGQLDLCSMCKAAYEAQRYCPNCAHSWDDVRFQKVRRQIDYSGNTNNRNRKRKKTADWIEDTAGTANDPLVFGAFRGDEVYPVDTCRVDPSWYYPETNEWGYTEVEMLVCDACQVWVHSGCAGIDEDEYELTSDGKHAIYSKEFLCRQCCRGRAAELIHAMEDEDRLAVFSEPVSDRVAPNYSDVIKQPMDLQTMLQKCIGQEYLNYAWVRECFELMVLNALTFNRFYTKVWLEARRFYHSVLDKVFSKIGKAAPPSKYKKEIEANFDQAEDARKMEEERVQIDETVEKKDLVAGSMAASVSLPELRASPPDQASCLPFREIKIKAVDAFYAGWMDACYTCGSSGAADTMLFCVDCGEAFHSFCVNAPVQSMEASSVAGWRCPNCKICEISGDVPKDDTRMIFCEMCDRAFSLELLDPPLVAAPPGLWVCGQCVDCQECHNKAELKCSGGASLKHWSRDPDKCYRCGGCEGLVEEYTTRMKCQVCAALLREDDEDMVECGHCGSGVHIACDGRAADHLAMEFSTSRAQKAQKIKNDEKAYACPRCAGTFAAPPTAATTDQTSLALATPGGEKKRSSKAADEEIRVASSLCGWTNMPGSTIQSEWRDPRECCLCHMCGDDDAGFATDGITERTGPDKDLPPLGRLLPLSDGFWVHTACALWSSEVWEDPNEGLVHAVEKARGRGAQLKCFGCGRHGATVGCNKANCPYNYHFQCAKACGAVFTSAQQVFCTNHKSSATGILIRESFEHMKALMVDPEKKSTGASADKDVLEGGSVDADLCSRVGALTVHALGSIEATTDGFHTESYIFSPGYVATRVFWSARFPRTRTVYVLCITRSDDNVAEFTIRAGDDPTLEIAANSVSQAYTALMDRVRKVNAKHFSQGDRFSKLPVIRRTRKKTFGLNGPQFFGFGLNHIRRMLETSPGVEAVAAPLNPKSPKYKFCFVLPSTDTILDIQRRRAADKAEQGLKNTSGCARTEGHLAVTRSGGSGRITRALVRSVEDDGGDTTSSATAKRSTRDNEEKAKADRNLTQAKYRRMSAIPIDQRLVARRSHIHGFGLFTKLDIPKDDPIVEYMGEVIRQPLADKRERAYEISGEGSCYMFRLDLHRIVDATMIGCMARFMNHSCQNNAYAKIISVDSDNGQERKIVVFANRAIAAGEEITYDYKFPVEDGSLKCTCGAPNCIGRLN